MSYTDGLILLLLMYSAVATVAIVRNHTREARKEELICRLNSKVCEYRQAVHGLVVVARTERNDDDLV